MTPKQLMKKLEKAGWEQVGGKGSHRKFRHPDRPEHIIIPFHRSDLKKGLEQAIIKQAGLK